MSLPCALLLALLPGRLVRSPYFQIIVKDLYTFLRKDVLLRWAEARHHVWNKIKQLLMKAPVVALPRDDLPYRLYLDASFEGLGGCLCQSPVARNFQSATSLANCVFLKEIWSEPAGVSCISMPL
jgi:RNase H-like domain found in reverse transcriptase